MKIRLFIIFVIILSIISPSLAAQEDSQPISNYQWHVSLSDAIIHIGETLYVNVSGYPNSYFDVVFTLISNSSFVWEEMGRTNFNGSHHMVLEMDLTRNPGRYAVALQVNNSVIEVLYVDIIYSEHMYNRIQIKDLEEIIESLQYELWEARGDISDVEIVSDKNDDSIGAIWFLVFILLGVVVSTCYGIWIDRVNEYRSLQKVNKAIDEMTYIPEDSHYVKYGKAEILKPGKEPLFPYDYDEKFTHYEGLTTEELLQEHERMVKSKDDLVFEEPKKIRVITSNFLKNRKLKKKKKELDKIKASMNLKKKKLKNKNVGG